MRHIFIMLLLFCSLFSAYAHFGTSTLKNLRTAMRQGDVDKFDTLHRYAMVTHPVKMTDSKLGEHVWSRMTARSKRGIDQDAASNLDDGANLVSEQTDSSTSMPRRSHRQFIDDILEHYGELDHWLHFNRTTSASRPPQSFGDLSWKKWHKYKRYLCYPGSFECLMFDHDGQLRAPPYRDSAWHSACSLFDRDDWRDSDTRRRAFLGQGVCKETFRWPWKERNLTVALKVAHNVSHHELNALVVQWEAEFIHHLLGDHDGVMRLYGSCFREQPTWLYANAVELLDPQTKEVLIKRPLWQKVEIMVKLVDLFLYLEAKRLLMCDFSRKQFGFDHEALMYKLVDVDSFVYVPPNKPIMSEAECHTDQDCFYHYRMMRPSCLINVNPDYSPDALDFTCDRRRQRCRGLDLRTQSYKVLGLIEAFLFKNIQFLRRMAREAMSDASSSSSSSTTPPSSEHTMAIRATDAWTRLIENARHLDPSRRWSLRRARDVLAEFGAIVRGDA